MHDERLTDNQFLACSALTSNQSIKFEVPVSTPQWLTRVCFPVQRYCQFIVGGKVSLMGYALRANLYMEIVSFETNLWRKMTTLTLLSTP
ncbi:MAG: hypothetical protein NZ805_16285 [Armatimonadetes bacterium]|nr:hypothetical protein [Armatimonadota bacterium]MDW8028868.1 hypothetical protein [Armatimonadota bacterium]